PANPKDLFCSRRRRPSGRQQRHREPIATQEFQGGAAIGSASREVELSATRHRSCKRNCGPAQLSPVHPPYSRPVARCEFVRVRCCLRSRIVIEDRYFNAKPSIASDTASPTTLTS